MPDGVVTPQELPVQQDGYSMPGSDVAQGQTEQTVLYPGQRSADDPLPTPEQWRQFQRTKDQEATRLRQELEGYRTREQQQQVSSRVAELTDYYAELGYDAATAAKWAQHYASQEREHQEKEQKLTRYEQQEQARQQQRQRVSFAQNVMTRFELTEDDLERAGIMDLSPDTEDGRTDILELAAAYAAAKLSGRAFQGRVNQRQQIPWTTGSAAPAGGFQGLPAGMVMGTPEAGAYIMEQHRKRMTGQG